MPFRYAALLLIAGACLAAGCRKNAFAAPPSDAQVTASGLASKLITAGTGAAHPTPRSTVTVNYTGWKSDGTEFDSSESHGGPQTFPLMGVIPGWTEGVQLMVKGEKRRFWIPGNLAYDASPDPTAPRGLLTFDVELVDFTTPAPPPPAPPDVAAPPADAVKTKSGLASKILTRGTGETHPTPMSTVTVNYTGWTPDGKMFDASAEHGGPATFQLGEVIPGWVEGLQLMVVGEKRRFWIPGNLAYDKSPDPSAPKGMLVFEVELLRIQ